MRVLAQVLLSLPVLMIGLCASAQTTTIPVRAGEHAQFTRLVIQVPEANSWRVTIDNRTAQLIVDGPPLQFDLSQTFARIPRTRLSNAVATPGNLELQLACDCEIRAYEDIPQFLVIDILGSGQLVAQKADSSIRPPERPVRVIQSGGAQKTDTARAGSDLARAMRGHIQDKPLPASLTLQKFADARVMPDPQRAPERPHDSIAPDPSYLDVTQELGRILAGSVALGVLEPASVLDAGAGSRLSENQPSHQPHQGLGDHLRLPSQDAALHLKTAQDRKPESCHHLARLDLVDWTPGTEIERKPRNLGALYGEFDKLDPEKGLDLIRHFLSLGFGAEVRLVAALLELPPPLLDLITGIALVLDEDPLPDSIDLRELQACSPAGSLWAFLGTPPHRLNSDFPFDALVQSVDALPPHLRLHLGPEILQRLAALGQIGPAMIIEAALDRVAAQNSTHFQLAKVVLALQETPTDRADALEKTLSPDLSDDALIFLMSRRDEQGDVVETHLTELAESRRIALRGDPRGSELTRLLARALARNGAYAEAFALAQAWDTGMAEHEILDLRQGLLDRLTEAAEDAEFVAQVFAQRPWSIDGLSRTSANSIAERLADLGFDEQAQLMRRPRAPASNLEQNPVSTPSGLTDLSANLLGETGLSFSGRSDAEADDVRRARQAQLAAQMRPVSRTGADASGSAETVPDDSTGTPDLARLSEPADVGTEPTEIAAPEQPRQASLSDIRESAPEEGLLALSRDALERSAALRTRLQEMLSERD